MENYLLSLISFINILPIRLAQNVMALPLATLIHIIDCNFVYLDSFGEFNEIISIWATRQSTILNANDMGDEKHTSGKLRQCLSSTKNR